MDEAVASMVDASAALGPETFARFVHEMDARLETEPGRLGQAAVRRAYAMAAYRYEFDAGKAKRRLDFKLGVARTPAEQLAEASQTATALSVFGLEDQARIILTEMHDEGLGYSRAARKDPQYLIWRDLFVKACEEDPAGRPQRLTFLGRLLWGLSDTEGRDAGRRLVRSYLDQAAQTGPAWARAAVDFLQETGLLTWHNIVAGLLIGVAKSQANLTATSATIFGRLGIPFASENDDSIYPQLISAAAPDQVEQVVRYGVTCVETDAHVAKRISFLEDIVEAGEKRGIAYGAEPLSRWRAELPPPRSGESPEDPFFLTRSWEEFRTILASQGDERQWGVARAFVRLAVRSGDYDSAKNIYNSVEALRNDDSSVEAIADAAIAARRREDLELYLSRLKQLAEGQGSWGGGWTSKGKQRYHKLNVHMSGAPAREAAFEAFVDDLTHRRESIENLLPNLDEVLELFSPQPSWADVWTRLQDHLSRFREYRMGSMIDTPAPAPKSNSQTLADILFRAFDTTATEVAYMARATAVELAKTADGSTVVAALLPALWRAGGHLAFELTRIIWECRDVAAVRDAVIPWFPEMANSDDCAIRRTAISLAREWNQHLSIRQRQLPAIYGLELPWNPQASRFEPPSGNSAFSSGLWTEDPYAWTWPLEGAISLTARATGIEVANLRARAAQLMSRMGGKDAFGPEAVKRQLQRFRQLHLHVGYHKLGVEAAFRAMREVVDELVAAEAIDPSALSLILHRSAAFATNVATIAPSARAPDVPQARIPDAHRTEEVTSWRDNVTEDAVEPRTAGFFVLASTAAYSRRYFREERTVEQYSGPDAGAAPKGLWLQLRLLPSVIIADRVICLYDELAEGAVVHPELDMTMSVGRYPVMLCPRVAAQIGWRPDSRHVFRYLDARGRLVAQSVWWRDGGVFSHESDVDERGSGCLLLVRKNAINELEPFLAKARIVRAWRATKMHLDDEKIVTSADRPITVAQ